MKAMKSALLALAIAQLVDGAPSHRGDDLVSMIYNCIYNMTLNRPKHVIANYLLLGVDSTMLYTQ